ncbi:IDEAL domain-containing protein [Paenibacillus tarimensis]|uniref:IDEAL domain-containing protein n=1 Tax=Paenibacillus tarimensis TaxID=416012 RepID=UPI001F186FF0|nr:IDEAL domain-containing protein [Paenibacillus tarimensis]MCF2942861.1 IDEAL domain-containing protein [Paenibacillus tarimensis]
MNNVQTADWVQGYTRNGELVHGFVEAIDIENGTIQIHVVASDNEEAVGTAVELKLRRVKGLPESEIEGQGSLANLIDLALATRDKEWFEQLTARLNVMRSRNSQRGQAFGKEDAAGPNKPGLYGLR